MGTAAEGRKKEAPMVERRRPGRRLWASCAVLAGLLAGAPAGAQPSCVGDCNGDGEVTIDEITRCIGIVLAIIPIDQCEALDANGDGSTAVNEIVLGVNNALQGCPGAPTTAGIVFNGEGNRLHAYQPSDGFPRQTVIPSDADDPGNGRDMNGQICFTRGPQGQIRFIAGEDTNQGATHDRAGWGLFELTGTSVGNFAWTQLNHLQPTYQTTTDGAENYGCGFLSDGRLVTTDVGNQAEGAGNGQLIMWYPPLDGINAINCKLDVAITTAQQIAIDDQDRIYVSSARGSAIGNGGVYRYTGPFPTDGNREGGCGRVDPTGAPLADDGLFTKELFIPADSHVSTPAGIVIRPGDGFYVASVLNGVIAEYDADGVFVRRVLEPPQVGPPPLSTGHPLGLGLASDGTLYYADVGLEVGPGGIGPGRDRGTVRRIRFVNGEPQPPETMDTGLNFPDGIGILELLSTP
jgi:hypothetical protein